MMKALKIKDSALMVRMHRLGVFEKDISESFIKSSGPGGQNVNKVSTCVVLIHKPTGITVKCQADRTQASNRYKARCLLVEKVERKQKDAVRKNIHEKEKERRKKRKRKKKTKETILEDKRRRSEKKKMRGKVNINKVDRL